MADTRITIAIITYKRPGPLAGTLLSLAKIAVPAGTEVNALVIDNDTGRTAYNVVSAVRDKLSFAIDYAFEGRKGIPYARNKALEVAAGSDCIAFIDDDDTADPNWLAALYDTMRKFNADVVKGRIVYDFPRGKEHLGTIDIFAYVPAATGSELSSAWTNNVLFSTHIYKNGLQFDTVFLKTGGSDSHFFRCAHAQGAKIVMCEEAVVRTKVPEKRTTWKWIAQRNMRIGATMTVSDIKMKGYGYAIRQTAASCLDSFKYFWRLLPGVFAGANHVIHPAMVMVFMAGRITGLLHISPKEYQ